MFNTVAMRDILTDTNLSASNKPTGDGWNNRLYLGDNLEILRFLQNDASIKGRIRLIYIDPPFGTGQSFTISPNRNATVSRQSNGSVAYNDNLTGKQYLDFLRPRLELLKELLADNGSIYVHIDCKIGHYVKVLLDDVFGLSHFRNDITRIKGNPKNFNRNSYANFKDTILFYTKGDTFVWHPPRQDFLEADLKRLFPKIDAGGRRYTTTPLHAPGETQNGATGGEWKGIKPPLGRHWRVAPSVLTELDNNNLIEWSKNGNPRKKIYADEASKTGKLLQDPLYPTEKNLEMLKVVVQASSNPSDLVMDCFCGSGGTLVAAQQLNRRWIGIDNSRTAIEICQKRLNIEDVSVV